MALKNMTYSLYSKIALWLVLNLVLLAVDGRSEEFRGILQRLAPVLNKTPLRALVKPGKDEP